jgi:hypothetical protein
MRFLILHHLIYLKYCIAYKHTKKYFASKYGHAFAKPMFGPPRFYVQSDIVACSNLSMQKSCISLVQISWLTMGIRNKGRPFLRASPAEHGFKTC